MSRIGIFTKGTDFLANINKKRFNFRITTSHFTFFSMLTRSQKIEGITSQVFDSNGKPTGNHYPFWDCDIADLDKVKKNLKRVQSKYSLSNIYVSSDKKGSFRAWCFSIVDFPTFLKILIDSLDIIDYGFFYYTVRRKEATLRLSRKENRPFQKCIDVIESYRVSFPSGIMKEVVYVTGCEKKGTTVNLGVN